MNGEETADFLEQAGIVNGADIYTAVMDFKPLQHPTETGMLSLCPISQDSVSQVMPNKKIYFPERNFFVFPTSCFDDRYVYLSSYQ